ncbi:MAG: helix-turn-helix transcriptional regulator [Spirochaetota bacterium]
MQTHKEYLDKQLKNPAFKEGYLREKKLVEFAVRIQQERQKLGLSQQELAKKAHVSQQQLSSIENGANYTIKTFLKITDALQINLSL